MAVAACPKPETLAAFARGELIAEELSAVAGHVGVCEICCRSLQLIPDDSLAGLARAAAVEPATVHSSGAPKPRLPAALQPNTNRIPDGFVDHPRYRVLGELGAGGMGTVYKVEDQAMGRIVAVKVVSPHLTAKSSAVTRFRKEVRAAAQLEHPNIIRAYDTGEAGGSQFLVMEYIEGISLDKLVAKKGPLPVNMACMFVRHAALGLQHAADKGMTHRDIKPQNIMVTRKGQVKILDFGLARFASTDDPEEQAPAAKVPFGAGKVAQNAGVTNPNLLMGTPDYLSPEQAKNSHEVDPRSDIYSLGCTLYFLLTGKPPFLSAATLIDKLLAHTNDDPPPIRMQRFEVTQGLADVLAKMMAKKPEDRYQTAKEAAEALYPHTRSTGAEPQFEVVEAVATTPAPLVATPVTGPVVAELASDTAPPLDMATLTDTPRPKKRKKSKKRGSWWQKWKWGIVSGTAALVLLVGVLIAANSLRKTTGNTKEATPDSLAGAKATPPAQGKLKEADDAKGAKGNSWTPPTVIGPPRGGLKVLYVLPSDGVWLHDYTDVRARLESRGVSVVTASTDGGSSKPHADLPGDPVPIDVKFTDSMNLSEYSAVVFIGYNSDEYIHTGKGALAATQVIQRMQQAGKPVAAMCLGEAVLAANGVLKGKRVAECGPLRWKHPLLVDGKAKITWDRPGVTIDRSEPTKVVITATGGRESSSFADAIADVLQGK